ncbi:MAG TPA: LLM class F420-dependent oxidoreductase [Trebonia sp.]|nr:LLM class F420-dependent oxidoreductase [Trebonia sp.]
MKAMELGVVVAPTDHSAAITDVAHAVEQAGLESLFLAEHTHVPVSRRDVLVGLHSQLPHILDQFTVLGAAAAVTSRLKLGTAVCIAAQRDPIILAKQVATVDYLSGGRFLFGVAAGWLEEEMRNHGVRPPLRWKLMREKLLAMQAIWTQDEAEFHGEFVDFDPILLWPKPVQVPHPPVLVGGSGPRSLRAAAEYGDGWMPIVEEAAEFETQLAGLHRLCEEASRPDMEVTAFAWEPDEQLLARCAELGVSRCIVWAPIQDLAALLAFLDSYARIADRAAR